MVYLYCPRTTIIIYPNCALPYCRCPLDMWFYCSSIACTSKVLHKQSWSLNCIESYELWEFTSFEIYHLKFQVWIWDAKVIGDQRKILFLVDLLTCKLRCHIKKNNQIRPTYLRMLFSSPKKCSRTLTCCRNQ
jgi:hypothetical protein